MKRTNNIETNRTVKVNKETNKTFQSRNLGVRGEPVTGVSYSVTGVDQSYTTDQNLYREPPPYDEQLPVAPTIASPSDNDGFVVTSLIKSIVEASQQEKQSVAEEYKEDNQVAEVTYHPIHLPPTPASRTTPICSAEHNSLIAGYQTESHTSQ